MGIYGYKSGKNIPLELNAGGSGSLLEWWSNGAVYTIKFQAPHHVVSGVRFQVSEKNVEGETFPRFRLK